MNQTRHELVGELRPAPTVVRPFRLPFWLSRVVRLGFILYLALILSGGSAITAEEAVTRHLAMTVAGHEFALLPWEFGALGAKVRASVTHPADDLSPAAGAQLVREYLARAQEIRALENQLSQVVSEAVDGQPVAIETLQLQLDDLRRQQAADRATVEQVIERQVASVLAEAGVTLPPVQFAFVEPPRKLVVSPRDRIETIYGQMLDAEMTPAEVAATEHTIRQEQNLSAYITGIGGLGAYPTMVIDSASLPWILSTVAHEWAHNYLTFYPLGFRYGVTSDNIIINETVADLVGNEIGEQVLRTYYPDLVPPPAPPTAPGASPAEPAAFNFDEAMRETRLTVDELLALGKVEDAETYMEARRLYFVENGYPLRVLNQAYFAFHGSYGGGPASTSPLGPKLQLLRTLLPDVKTFLETVRSFTTPADVDQALVLWAQDGQGE